MNGPERYRAYMLGWEDGAAGNLMDQLIASKEGTGTVYLAGFLCGYNMRQAAHAEALRIREEQIKP